MSPTANEYDAVIVGAGDVGTALARQLARYELRVALLESRADVGAGTSKANTAILHTGFDAKPGTLEARLVARGHDLLADYAAEVGIPLEHTGALLVAWDEQQLARFDEIRENARRNGYERVREVSCEELYGLEPHLGPGALGALHVPDEHIVCPWTPPLACATQAVLAGVELRCGEPIMGLDRRPEGGWTAQTPRGTLATRWVLNTAGLFSDEIHRMAGYDGFTVVPRRGELIVFDKLTRPLLNHVVLPVPTATTKGVLVAPTVFGNVMLGPTAEDLYDKAATGTSVDGLESLWSQGQRIMPELLTREVTATYAGLRAATEHADYQLVVDGDARGGYACAGGIRSTGLTASLAIAEYLRDELDSAGLELRERREDLPSVRMPNIGEAFLRPYADAERIACDPAYGRIACFCERVSEGEIRDAACAAVPARDLDGLRRRTRALMGRCQGFFCSTHVAGTLAKHSGCEVRELWELER